VVDIVVCYVLSREAFGTALLTTARVNNEKMGQKPSKIAYQIS